LNNRGDDEWITSLGGDKQPPFQDAGIADLPLPLPDHRSALLVFVSEGFGDRDDIGRRSVELFAGHEDTANCVARCLLVVSLVVFLAAAACHADCCQRGVQEQELVVLLFLAIG
jgi:hypothetical protein